MTPAVLSWQQDDGHAASFDYPGTWDYAGWLAAGDGLAYWADLGGWDAGYLRIAAAPYNTADDYGRLASSVRELLDRQA